MKSDRPTVPFGLGYALAENTEALRFFSSLSSERQKEIIESTRGVTTKLEFRNFVENMRENEQMR